VEDSWRVANPFSDDLETVNRVLFNPYASATQKRSAVSFWLQKFQPCLFGKIAAVQDTIHYCLIGDHDIQRKTDGEISDLIHRELLEWKRRALNPQVSAPAHAFLLLVYSPGLATAAPDNRLLEFARQVRYLWGCAHTNEPQGVVHWENLYLEHPQTHRFSKFEVPVDFFASQGDGRWWHDHRAPGGIFFTANSVGHMQKYREWYKDRTQQQDWVLQTAMLTIASAAETPYGKGTWLREIPSGGCPFVADIPNPFSQPEKLKVELRDKDWTRYLGYFHTDHSIRSEFFNLDPAIPSEIAEREWLQDFTYIYDHTDADHQRLISGVDASPAEIDKALGPVRTWHHIRGPVNRVRSAKKILGEFLGSTWRRSLPKSDLRIAEEAQLNILMAQLADWNLPARDVAELEGL